MTDKRFTYMIDRVFDLWGVYDNKEKVICLVRNTDAKDLCDLLNALHEENKKLKQVNEMLQMDFAMTERNLIEENGQLKKEIYLMHMRSMFSTVKSFKGDVSKRYKYSGETDNIYDAANHYGQYDKILDKKEITMLLNEYETVLNELNEESGHIKNIMREAYLAERTMLGKSVLKQLMERIGIDGGLSGID